MLTQKTVDRLHQMRLLGMAEAFVAQLHKPDYQELSFEERFGLLVDQEWTHRQNRRLARLLRQAKLRLPACHGVGETFIACAPANAACRHGCTARYYRVPRLLAELGIARGDGSYPKLLNQLARTDLLVLDDWGLTPLTDAQGRDLLEVVDDRDQARSTIVASQLPVGGMRSTHQTKPRPTF